MNYYLIKGQFMIQEFKDFVDANFPSVHAFVKKYRTPRSSAYQRYNKESGKYYVAIIEGKPVVLKEMEVLELDEI